MTTRKSLRVLLLTHTGVWGGSEVHALKFAGALRRRGHGVRIIGLSQDVYREPCLRASPPIDYQRVQLPRPVRAMGYWGWKSVFRTFAADVCILVKNCFTQGSVALDLAARHSFRRYLTVEHLAGDPIPPRSSRRYLGGLLPRLGLWWYRHRLGCYLRSLGPHRVVCVSDAVRHRLVCDYGFAARKTITIHNGIDPKRFQPSPDLRATTRSAWGIPEDALVFGAIGRLDNAHKGYEVAVHLFAEVKRLLPSQDVRLVLVGEGPDEQALKALAGRLEVGPLVRFPGFTSRPWEVYPALDVFVMPSRNEGLPYALVEAMACGCCPIAMGVGGVPEVISDPEVGWLVAPEDRHGFLGAMMAAAGYTLEERLQMGRRARAHVEGRFNEKVQLGALADLVEVSHSGRPQGK